MSAQFRAAAATTPTPRWVWLDALWAVHLPPTGQAGLRPLRPLWGKRLHPATRTHNTSGSPRGQSSLSPIFVSGCDPHPCPLSPGTTCTPARGRQDMGPGGEAIWGQRRSRDRPCPTVLVPTLARGQLGVWLGEGDLESGQERVTLPLPLVFLAGPQDTSSGTLGPFTSLL